MKLAPLSKLRRVLNNAHRAAESLILCKDVGSYGVPQMLTVACDPQTLQGSDVEVKRALAIFKAFGVFKEMGRNHGRPVYGLKVGEVGQIFIYYWDTRRDDGLSGWWFGSEVGIDLVFANHASAEALPPCTGWKFPWDGLVQPGFTASEQSDEPDAQKQQGDVQDARKQQVDEQDAKSMSSVMSKGPLGSLRLRSKS